MLGVIVLSRLDADVQNHGPFLATGFSGNPIRRLIRAYKTLDRWVVQYKVDIISSQEPFESGCIAWLVARKHNIKFEVQLHGDFYGNSFWKKQSLKNRFRAVLGLYIARRAHGIRVVSERIKKSLVSLAVKEKNISVIPVGAQTNLRQYQSTEEGKPFTVLVVSRLTPEKNVTLMTRAMPYIKGGIPHAQCMVVGDGPQKVEVMASAKSLGIAESVHLHGYRKNLDHYYALADVVVIPSYTEGWGRVVIEAMSCNKPIVMTDVGVAGEIINDGKNGLIVPINDAGALAEAVIKLYKNPTLAQRIATQARADFEKLPSSQETQKNMIDAWKLMLKPEHA